jgi:hypothetical protein
MRAIAIQLVLLLVVFQATHAQEPAVSDRSGFGIEQAVIPHVPALRTAVWTIAAADAAGHSFQASASAFWLHVGAGWVTRESLSGGSFAGIVGASWQPGASIDVTGIYVVFYSLASSRRLSHVGWR